MSSTDAIALLVSAVIVILLMHQVMHVFFQVRLDKKLDALLKHAGLDPSEVLKAK